MEGVEDDEVAAGEGVDEAAAVALSEDVKHAGLVEVGEVNEVLHCVLVRRVGLKREGGGREGGGEKLDTSQLKSHDDHLTVT